MRYSGDEADARCPRLPLFQGQGAELSSLPLWCPQSIAEQAGVDETAGGLGIGPGIGPLTQQLCLRAGKVCAVEVDERLKPILDVTVGNFSNLEILWGDVLKQDIPALVKEKFGTLRPMACANLPYYITSPFSRRCWKRSASSPSPSWCRRK